MLLDWLSVWVFLDCCLLARLIAYGVFPFGFYSGLGQGLGCIMGLVVCGLIVCVADVCFGFTCFCFVFMFDGCYFFLYGVSIAVITLI